MDTTSIWLLIFLVAVFLAGYFAGVYHRGTWRH
jgi:hypothetical protein